MTRARLLLAGAMTVAALSALTISSPRLRAQAGTPELSAVVAELRQLRLAVEDATRAQTQTQGLAVYLSAQQSRFVQTSSRLDAVRKDLDAAVGRVRTLTAELADLQRAFARATEFRAEYEGRIEQLKRDLAQATDTEQRLRLRETELTQAFQQDEATWRDLIARLEQTIKR